MKQIILASAGALALAACDTPQQGALTGAALGAATGVAVSGEDDREQGLILGALAGAAAGNFIGRTQSGQCVYRNASGGTFVAACP
ncbi:MAG: glycine zipper 2TM domain-containing protein [Hasllibacter sp.]